MHAIASFTYVFNTYAFHFDTVDVHCMQSISNVDIHCVWTVYNFVTTDCEFQLMRNIHNRGMSYAEELKPVLPHAYVMHMHSTYKFI